MPPQDEASNLLKLADQHLSQGFGDEALSASRESARISREKSDKPSELLALQTSVSALSSLSRHDEALREAARASTLAKGIKDKAGEARACAQAAKAHLAKRSVQAALEKAKEAAALYKSAGDKKGEAASLQSSAEADLLRKGADEALKACGQSVALFKEAGDDAGVAGSLVVTALAHELKADYAAGLASAREALVLFSKAKDKRGLELAKETCALLRRKQGGGGRAPAPPKRVAAHMQFVPGVGGPASLPREPCVSCVRICGPAESRKLSGMVAVVTGASRGVGKGVAQTLVDSGAVVYMTGRSKSAGGAVDEAVASLGKLSGVGVAAHADHNEEEQTKALVDLVSATHGRLDVLVNNGFYTPSPGKDIFQKLAWSQPSRFFNEQDVLGSHAASTLMFAPCLRRGKGLVLNMSSWGSAANDASKPSSYKESNAAAMERTSAAVAEQMRTNDVSVMSLWTGTVKTERAIADAEQNGTKLNDLESTRYVGQAVSAIANMRQHELSNFSCSHRILSAADVARFELDGYSHQGGLHAFASGRRAVPSM